MSTPKVSIIIPVYNGADFLSQAIDSARSQTYPNIEILVVDDGSIDQTWEVIQSYGQCVTGYRKENGGVASALNWGIQHSTGNYIAWLSHDDMFEPNKIAAQVEFLQKKPDFIACYTDFIVVDAQGHFHHRITSPWFPRQEALRQLFAWMYINGSTTLIRRECFDLIGFYNESCRYTQDFDMWVRILRKAEIGKLEETLVRSRTHPAQGSWNHLAQIDEEQVTCTRLFWDLHPGELAISEVQESQAYLRSKALVWLGDWVLTRRKWYRYAQNCYHEAGQLWGESRKIIWVRQLWALLMIFVFGDEKELTARKKLGIFYLRTGQNLMARQNFWEAYQSRPFRLDLCFWLALTFFPLKWVSQLRSAKQMLNRLHG